MVCGMWLKTRSGSTRGDAEVVEVAWASQLYGEENWQHHSLASMENRCTSRMNRVRGIIAFILAIAP
jgi:hypothetical protein